MNEKMKEEIVASIQEFKLPRYREIPDVGLYLEQVAIYISDSLAPLGNVAFTRSMISNYVKKGLVPSPIKKQYFAEHIAYLFFITIAKTIISLDNVSLMWTDDALNFIAKAAKEKGTGARGLKTIIEKSMTDLMFEVPSMEFEGQIFIELKDNKIVYKYGENMSAA